MRLQQEGHVSVLAVHPPSEETGASDSFQAVGKNLVDQQPLADLLAGTASCANGIGSGTAIIPCGRTNCSEGEGFRVFGGGLFPDLMEHDRDFAIRYCANYGLHAPETPVSADGRQAIAFLERRRRTAFLFKPDRGHPAETWVPDDLEAEAANFALRRRLQSWQPSGPFTGKEARHRGQRRSVVRD